MIQNFVDSSSYTKLFVTEHGSDEMFSFFRTSRVTELAVSQLVLLEVRSALRRREQSGQLTGEDAGHAVLELYSLTMSVRQVEVTPYLLFQAAPLVDRHTLRALDAIQLASALSLGQSRETRFIASDLRLLHAAASEGFLTWNPADGPCPR